MMATDLSHDCEHIGARAVELAERFDARLSLLHVVEQIPVDLSDELMITPPVEPDPQLLDDARAALDRLARTLNRPDASCQVETGFTKEEILRVVQDQAVDLLVLGRHSRHGLALLLGSTARSVMNDCPCDVLAVNLPD